MYRMASTLLLAVVTPALDEPSFTWSRRKVPTVDSAAPESTVPLRPLALGLVPAAARVHLEDGGREGSGGGGITWFRFHRFSDATRAAAMAFDTAVFGSDPVVKLWIILIAGKIENPHKKRKWV